VDNIKLNKKILLISILCIFFICISASYASTTNDIVSDSTTKNSATAMQNLDKAVNGTNQNTKTINENTKTISENTKTSSEVKTATKSNDKWKAAGDRPKKLTQSQILAASKKIDNFVKKNKRLPNSVTIAGYKFSMQEYGYMLSKTIVNRNNKKMGAITIRYNVKDPNKPSGVTIKGRLTKNQYNDLAKRMIKFMDSKKQAPNFVTTKLGQMQYQTTLHTLARVGSIMHSNKGRLPNSLNVNVGKNHNLNKVLPKYTRPNVSPNPAPSPSKTLSIAEIKNASNRLNEFVAKNKVLPKTVTLGGKQYSMSDFLFILSKAIVNLDKRITSNIAPIDTSSPTKTSGQSINGNLTKEEYVDLATRVSDFIVTNKQAPNYGNTPLGRMQYQTMISEFSKIIGTLNNSNQLPDNIIIDVKSSDPINGKTSGDISTPSLNDKYTGEDLGKYLKATKNCQVNAASIKSLANTITKGLKTELQKATAIFKWVSTNIKYSFYYNTRKGATGTLTAKSGNCVDQSHLSIALYRAAGLAARYVSGTCTFSSGSRYGHVWAQVKVGNTWLVSDTTSTRNSLGTIKNWNPSTMTIKHGKIAEIFF